MPTPNPSGILVVPDVVATAIKPLAPANASNALDYAIDQAYEFGIANTTAPTVLVVDPVGGYDGFSDDIKKVLRASLMVLAGAMLKIGAIHETWHSVGGAGEPAFTNSWVNQGGAFQVAQFRKEGDLVRLRGNVKSGTTAMFTLPVGYRPPAEVRYAADNATSGAPAFIKVTAAGVVELVSGTNTQIGLDGICFSVTA